MRERGKIMDIYLDTANEQEIEFASKYGFLAGITTNPSIISRENREFRQIIVDISSKINGEVWCQVTGETAEEMILEGREMSTWGKDIVIKLPMTEEGLSAAYQLKQEGIKVNMTLIYTLPQVVLAAKAGVDFISPYIGRMDDHAIDGLQFIKEAKEIIHQMHAETKVIGASIRNPQVVVDLAKSGADAVTMPFYIFKKMFASDLTNIGLKGFLKDWKQYQSAKKSEKSY